MRKSWTFLGVRSKIKLIFWAYFQAWIFVYKAKRDSHGKERGKRMNGKSQGETDSELDACSADGTDHRTGAVPFGNSVCARSIRISGSQRGDDSCRGDSDLRSRCIWSFKFGRNVCGIRDAGVLWRQRHLPAQ